MKEVKSTKHPTIKQMQNMAFNLKSKFDKPSYTGVKIWDFKHKDNSLVSIYKLYVEDTYNLDFDSWKILQDKYFEIMKGE